MTLVRCPGCSTTAQDPASQFRCASCARLLRWRLAASPTLALRSAGTEATDGHLGQ